MTPSSPPSYTFLDTQRSPLLTSLASKLPNPSTNIPHQTSIPTAPPITDPTQSPPHTGPNSPGPTFPTNQPTSHEPNNIQTQTQNNPLPPPIFDPPNPQTNTNPVNEPPRTHPMITRSQSGIVKPIERLSLHTSSLSPIPKSPFIALKDPNWCNAMYDEYNALVKNGTWILVPRPSDVNLVRSMWLFKHKFHADGTLSRYKARLVANGSNQQHGVDFDETFSPVVKPATIRTVLSLAVSRQWPIHQLDVKNAFLNGDLSETVYMHQPPGFVDSRYPNHVCLLQRSLYGLKQAPRAWFQRFAGYATRAGFSPSRCDSSLFIYTQGSQVAYLLIYVDDIILTASSPVLLQQIVDSLHKEFDMTDLGALNYFLGISASPLSYTFLDTQPSLLLTSLASELPNPSLNIPHQREPKLLTITQSNSKSYSLANHQAQLFLTTSQLGSQVAYLLLYVDDIILTASSTALLQQLINYLHREFDMTDLGALNYFLGIYVVRHSTVDTESKLRPDGVPVQDPTM
ncbi:ribonuclease H-like domain-containing protein [Tanacetum coccineum]